MAIIEVGPIVSDIRGSINGVTFGRNPAGLFARQRVAPVNPNSPLQVLRRGQLAQIAVGWRDDLSQARRDAWNALGSVTTFKNALGQDFNPSGIQLFIRTNVLRLIAVQSPVLDPPVQATIQLGTLTVEHVLGSGIEITAVVGSEVENGDMIVRRSTDLSQGILFFNSPFFFQLTFPVEDLDPPPRLIVANADLIPDRRYFLTFRVIQNTGEVTAAAIHTVVTSDPL